MLWECEKSSGDECGSECHRVAMTHPSISTAAAADSFNTESEAMLLSEVQIQAATPKNVSQLWQSSQKDFWIQAMNREKRCHVKNKTFGEVSEEPHLVKAIPADWIFKMKHRGPADSLECIDACMYKSPYHSSGSIYEAGARF